MILKRFRGEKSHYFSIILYFNNAKKLAYHLLLLKIMCTFALRFFKNISKYDKSVFTYTGHTEQK